MKNTLLIITFILILLNLSAIKAQEPPVLFEVSTETYELLENPISINEGEIWEPETNYVLEFDFDFEINGKVFNQVLIDAGIGLTFPGYNNPNLWIWASEWGGWPFLFDRGSDVSLSPIDYEVTGEEGEQILKIQWQNAGIRDNEGDDPDDFVDFQIWICQGTNRAEIHYGPSQISDLSFGYNDGPGFRFWGIENDWGYCLSGYQNLPGATWMEFIGPIGGCLLDGVPDEGKVFNFFPNISVSVPEFKNNNNLDFSVINQLAHDEVQIKIIDFALEKLYRLYVYNILGVMISDQLITSQNTMIKMPRSKSGIYLLVLADAKYSTSRKIFLN